MFDDKMYFTQKALINILKHPRTLDKIICFKSYGNVFDNSRIILFDEMKSNFDDSFMDKNYGVFNIVGLGDYKKTWVLDNRIGIDKVFLKAGKTLDFDLNIVTYLNKLFTGKKCNIDKEAFIKYLTYIKDNQFQCSMVTATFENAKSSSEPVIFSEMIKSFIEFENISSLKEINDFIYLSPKEYTRMKFIYEEFANVKETLLEQFDVIYCLVMKAIMLKKFDDKLSKDEKINELIYFCLNRLNCYLEKEIVLLSLYIMDDSKTHKIFKKINKQNFSISDVLNVTWDIYHIRLLEQIMLYDYNHMVDKSQIVLPFYATADKGIIEAMKINPLKAFAILDGYPIAVHRMNIEDVCNDEELLTSVSIDSEKRKINIKHIDFNKMRYEMEEKLKGLQNDNINII